jgi:hypothetical protein
VLARITKKVDISLKNVRTTARECTSGIGQATCSADMDWPPTSAILAQDKPDRMENFVV